jgi:hypothetical protein
LLLNKTNSETNLTRSRQGLEIAKTAAAAAAALAFYLFLVPTQNPFSFTDCLKLL